MRYQERSCSTKIRHATKHRAKQWMKRLAKFDGKPASLYCVYGCPFCLGFHVGHKREDIEQSRRDIERYAEDHRFDLSSLTLD